MEPKIYLKESELPNDDSLIINAFDVAVKELFFLENPNLKKDSPGVDSTLGDFFKSCKIDPVWIYYQPEKVIVKTVPEEFYFKLRTSRNRNIITAEEQKKFRDIKIGVAGLSVGSAIISALVQSGGPKFMKIADFDEVEVTNLNRIHASLHDVGRNKTDVAARKIWELDPYAHLELFRLGINKDNLDKFLLKPKIDIFIDEMDSIDLKILARFVCKNNQIPVLMATDNGDSIILDVERFDLEPERKIFHGLIDVGEELGKLDYKTWLKLAAQIVGPQYLTEKMQQSVLQIGKTISSVPQLGPTANMAGAAMAYCVRAIANNQVLQSGRYVFGLEESFIPGYNEPRQIQKRKEQTDEFIKSFGNL